MPRRQPSSLADRFSSYKQDYRAAKQTRFRPRRTGVPHLGAGADWHYRSETDYIRVIEDVRDMERNDVVTSPLLKRVTDNTIQGGFVPDPNTGDDAVDEQLLARWNDWSTDADATDLAGEHTFHDLEQLVFRSMLRDGDIIPLPLEEGQVELVEAHRCRSPSNARSRQTRNIVHGVQLDALRRRTDYWFTKDELDPFQQVKLKDLTRRRVRDDQGNRLILHVYNPNRVSQTRGVTAFAPIFDYVGMHDDVEFAKVLHQQVVSCFALIETAEEFSAPEPGQFGQETTETRNSVARTLEGIAPGMHIPVPAGHTVQMASPNVPNPEFFPHVKLILQLIGINVGMPLVVFLMDASETNFSGWRGAFDQAKLGFECNQRSLVSRFHRPVWNWRARIAAEDDAALGRALERFGLSYFRHGWNRPAWPYIEPLKDAQADLLQTRNAINSPRRIQAARGRDWEVVALEIVKDNGLAIEAAAKEAERLNAILPDDQKVHWRELISLPTPDGVSLSLDTGRDNANDDNRPNRPAT